MVSHPSNIPANYNSLSKCTEHAMHDSPKPTPHLMNQTTRWFPTQKTTKTLEETTTPHIHNIKKAM
jgi:hypothetical protein